MFILLVRKELRELFASRAYWLLLLIVGLLVGHAFVTAANLYAEMSGGGGGPAALSQGLRPLDGIVVPTMGAYDLAAMLLFPFVVIRLVADEKRSGALHLMLQSPASMAQQMLAKVSALLIGWVVAWVPGVVALVLWTTSGGHLYGPETLSVFAGHFVGGVIAIGIAMAAAALTDGAAAAAVVTLAITLGMWALEFSAAVHGGMLEELAQLTPGGVVHRFERGELAAQVMLAPMIITAGFVTIAGWCVNPGRPRVARIGGSAIIVFVAVLLAATCEELRWSKDMTEDRRNSFLRVDEDILRKLPGTLRIEIHLAPEDPRLEEFERETLHRLERIVPRYRITRESRSTTGLFEGAADRYGEIWYSLAGKRTMSRSVIPEAVLDGIYGLAGITPPDRTGEERISGFPSTARAPAAPWVFYLGWPVTVGLLYWLSSVVRRKSGSGYLATLA